MASVDRIHLFGVPLRVSLVDDSALVTAARDHLVARSKSEPGITRSQVGGWHSPPDLGRHRDAPIGPLLDRLATEAREYVLERAVDRGTAERYAHRIALHAWAMVLPAGGYVTCHDHAEAHVSGVCYLDAGDGPESADDLGGRIVFRDPAGGRADIPGLELSPSDFVVQPKTGMVLLFPGYVPHYVHPYRGTRPRVCVSFNVRFEPQPRG